MSDYPTHRTQKYFAFCRPLILLIISMLPASAIAGYQCDRHSVPASVRSCPDGSIPVFVADEPKPYTPAQPAEPVRRSGSDGRTAQQPSNSSDPAYFFGVWQTNVPGAVWTTPSEVQGYDRLRASPGALAGDLVIDPNGTYTWNSFGGKSGRWVRGDSESPIVLIDSVENRRWQVLPDKTTGGREIYLYDGNSFSYRGRR